MENFSFLLFRSLVAPCAWQDKLCSCMHSGERSRPSSVGSPLTSFLALFFLSSSSLLYNPHTRSQSINFLPSTLAQPSYTGTTCLLITVLVAHLVASSTASPSVEALYEALRRVHSLTASSPLSPFPPPSLPLKAAACRNRPHVVDCGCKARAHKTQTDPNSFFFNAASKSCWHRLHHTPSSLILFCC